MEEGLECGVSGGLEVWRKAWNVECLGDLRCGGRLGVWSVWGT